MSVAGGGSRVVVELLAAGLLFLMQLALSVVLVAVSLLSRVALHRIGAEAAGQLRFLPRLHDPASTHRLATTLMRQLCLMGGTLCVILAARHAGWPHPALVGLAAGTALGVLIVEALAARALAVWEPRVALRRSAFVVPVARSVLYPLVAPLSALLVRVGQLQQAGEEDEQDQEEEVEAFIEVGERDGILEASESRMMRGIVDLDETAVREIMTPRTDIVALPVSTTVGEARRVILREGHSRVPVYREAIDNVVGVLYVRELLRAWEAGQDAAPVSDYLRDVMFVPETLSVAELLAEMRVKTHIALVVDEYGGVAGLVTLEDLLEEIVGDIRDEHDPEEAQMRQEPDGSWTIDAATHVEELEELFDVEFSERGFDTVGGLVVSSFGRVPAEGEKLGIHGLEFVVLEADSRRIHSVRVRRSAAPGEAQAAP
jgi:magnesium and cobalt transporter